MPFYFAYGANMSSRVFEERRQITAISKCKAQAPGWKRSFTQPGVPIIEPVFALLEKDANASCWGALYEISDADMESLTRMETEYDQIALNVQTPSETVQAKAFTTHRRSHNRKPSRRYMGILLDGANELSLPEEVVRSLTQQPTSHVPLLSSLVPMVVKALDRSRK